MLYRNFWQNFDTDNSGTLDSEEYKFFVAGMADAYGRVIIKASNFDWKLGFGF